MKNLLCKDPAIILNPRLKELVCRYKNYTIRGEYNELTSSSAAAYMYDFPYKTFGTKRLNITIDDIDNCYIIDKITGEMIPIYMAVPCNKCVICRDKAARDWSTRAMCEAQTSNGYPLFVTLTYNDHCLPKNGVRKKAAQNFLKRLRINLNRYLGYDVNLRFFLCAEYGSKSARPHYHALLYNFPTLDTLKRTLSIIEKSWSYVVTKKYADTLNSDYKFFDEKAKRWRVRYGFVHLQLAQGGHVKYAMKYMRKDATIPKGSNDVFYLSSRKRGLGYQWLEQHIDEYYNNPQNYDVQFTDIWSCTACKFMMPQYFKSILYPCISRVIPKKIRDTYGNYVDCINKRNAILKSISYKPCIYSDELAIINKYRPLPTYLCEVGNLTWMPKIELEKPSYVDVERKDGYLIDAKIRVLPYALDDYNALLDNVYKENEKLIEKYANTLRQYEFNASNFDNMKERNNIRLYYLSQYMDAQPQANINDVARQIHCKRQRQLNAEKL